jgi:hypothetical protein
LKKIGPGKAKVLKNLVQTQLKFEENWSRQSLSLKKIGPAKLKLEENWSRQSLSFKKFGPDTAKI